MRGGPVTPATGWMRVGLLACAAVGLPFACASQDDPAASPEEPEPSKIPELPTDAGGAETLPDVDAGTRCSASKICVEKVPIDEFVHLTSVWGSSANDVWAVGAHGTVLHYDGTAWKKADVATANGGLVYTLRSVWLERPDDVWIVDGTTQSGGGGILRHSSGWSGPSAVAWSFFTPDEPFGFEPLVVRGKGSTVWIAHAGFRMLETFDGWSADGPSASRTFAPPNMGSVTALAVTRADEVWAAGSCDDESFVSHFGCVFRGSLVAGPAPPTWEFEPYDSQTDKVLRAAWGDESGVWLAGEAGTLRRGTRAAVPNGKLEVVTSPVVADLEAVFGFAADDVWAVGEASTVLHWDGAVWTKLSTPFDGESNRPALHAVWGSSSKDIWIAGDGTMLRYREEKTP